MLGDNVVGAGRAPLVVIRVNLKRNIRQLRIIAIDIPSPIQFIVEITVEQSCIAFNSTRPNRSRGLSPTISSFLVLL